MHQNGTNENSTARMLTQSAVLTRSQATELAILARICTAPSNTHRMYDVENTVVQTALKHRNINLIRLSVCHKRRIRESVQGMITRARPGIMFVPGVDEEGGKAEFSHGDECH